MFTVSCVKLNIHLVNVQGLERHSKTDLLICDTILYKTAFKKVKTVYFENQVNADEFVD